MSSLFSPEKARFFAAMEKQYLALTFNDVRLRTRAGQQAPLPDVLDIAGKFSENVGLRVPLVSAAMDTVTESSMAIAMAQQGGLGVIHAAMSVEDQRREVQHVKKAVNGLINKPISVSATDPLETVLNMCAQEGYQFRTFPVVDSGGKFVGLLTGDDFKYPDNLSVTVGETMRLAKDVKSVSADTTLPDAYKMMKSLRISTLPVIRDDGTVLGLYLFSDVSRIVRDKHQYNVDAHGQLRTAAAVSTGPDALVRVEAMRKYLDVLVIDTADGNSYYAFQTLKQIKAAYPDLDVVVGNVSDGASALALAKAGANGIKVGQGPGSICTTRRETGIGMPQVTAVSDCVRALGKEFAHIPVCADGGIKEHGDIPIAFAAGAHSVMMGRVLAGTREAPGAVIVRHDGAHVKVYRGMGSASALRDNEASRQRYGAGGTGKILAEGVEAQIPYEGNLEDVLELYKLALIKGMRYVKAPTLDQHRAETLFTRITNAGLRESHPHDVDIISQ